MHYAKDVLQKRSVVSLILAVNKQSIRVAEKNGMIFDRETLFHGQMHRVYRICFD
jgi:ribosomal-protein-alanine N-acetyltransferase